MALIGQEHVYKWQVNIKTWKFNIIIWQVMAEICHSLSCPEACCNMSMFVSWLIDWLIDWLIGYKRLQVSEKVSSGTITPPKTNKRTNERPLRLVVCLLGLIVTLANFISHMETSPLPVKGCECWPLLGTDGHWAVRVL